MIDYQFSPLKKKGLILWLYNYSGGYKNLRKKNLPDYESNTYNQGSHNSNSNPYENANAPPEDDVFGTPMKPYSGNTNTNLGYPSYPNSGSNGGNNNNNNGYPPYPTNQQPPRNDGYPPYPTNNNNRMPIPGQSGYPPYGGQSNYPQSNNNQYPLHPPPGYQSNNGQRYPSYGNYPNNYYSQSNSRNYYRPNSSISSMTGSTITMIMMLTSCFALLTISRNIFVPWTKKKIHIFNKFFIYFQNVI